MEEPGKFNGGSLECRAIVRIHSEKETASRDEARERSQEGFHGEVRDDFYVYSLDGERHTKMAMYPFIALAPRPLENRKGKGPAKSTPE